jgi:hypothetical protein
MQTDYNDLTASVEGGLADIGFTDKVSRAAGANVAQVATITIDTEANTTAYTFVVNGHTITYTSDASGTFAEIQAGLVAAGVAMSWLTGVVTFGGVSPDVTITADVAGTPMTVTEADSNLTLVATTANATGNPIPFGRGLAQNLTNAELVALPGATGFTLAGVSVQTNQYRENSNGLAQYREGQAITTLRKGRIWVTSEDAITSLADAVYIRHTANGAVNLPGRFRTDGDSSKADVVANAEWKSLTTAVNQLALLEINLP